LRVTGDDEHVAHRPPIVSAGELGQHVEPVARAEVAVEQDQLGVELAHGGHEPPGIRFEPHRADADELEQPLQQQPVALVVLEHEDTQIAESATRRGLVGHSRAACSSTRRSSRSS
jgi:hypothetical protein